MPTEDAYTEMQIRRFERFLAGLRTAFPDILPSLGNEFITLFKDTSLVSAIGGAELIYYAKAIGAKTYEPMFPYLGVAVMYLAAVLVLTWLQGKLERRLRQSDRR